MKYDDDIEHIYLDDEDQAPAKPAATSGGHAGHVEAVETKEEYKKLYYILAGITVVSLLLSLVRGFGLVRFMCDFMAVFFVTFAAFKFYDIEGFAHGFRNYDILAKRIRPYGYFYPFIELFLGLWYLLSEAPTNLLLLTLLVTGVSSIGVWKELKRKSRFHCACLGTFIRLPLSRVSFIENATMFTMAGIMLFL